MTNRRACGDVKTGRIYEWAWRNVVVDEKKENEEAHELEGRGAE